MSGTMWGIVADDLTGAADSAAGFAARGWDVSLVVGEPSHPMMDRGSDKRALAFTTDARSLADADAAERTASAVRTAVAVGCTRLYVKVDSTVRGSVPGQVRGALRAWDAVHSDTTAVVCPAFPVHGRSVRDGIVCLDGVPLRRPPGSHDPIIPASDNSLLRMFPSSVLGHPADIGRYGILVVDAETDGDLDALADAFLKAPDVVVAVGSGGLAHALARRSSPIMSHDRMSERSEVGVSQNGGGIRRTLVAISSAHPVSVEQATRLLDAACPEALVLTIPPGGSRTPDDASQELADRVVARVTTEEIAGLVLVGGDGASAILRALGALSVDIVDELSPGCPIGRIVGGVANGCRVVTKSGGFGHGDTLLDLLRLLNEVHVRDKPSTGSKEDERTP